MKSFSLWILLAVTLLTGCGGGGGGSSTPTGTSGNFSSSSAASSSSETFAAPANINITPGAKQFTITWNQQSDQQYNLFVFDSPSCSPSDSSQCPNVISTNNISSPYTPKALENKKNYWVYLEAAKGTNIALSPAYFVRSDDRVFDGAVNAIQVDTDGTTYLGGKFERYGVPVGNGYITDAVSGMPQKFPFVSGFIRTSVSDGKGGWYVGGDFLYVEGQKRTYLAHILPDGSLDSWSPVINGSVTALAFAEDRLYVSGVFTTIDNKQRNRFAAFTNTGTLTDWSPSSSGYAISIALFNNKIYVAGSFSAINGLSRANLAAINKDGTVDGWTPVLDGVVETLLSTNDILYVGGRFAKVNDQPRSALAAFDKTGMLTNWNPVVLSDNGYPPYVSALVELNSLVYIGGNFNKVNGSPRIRLAALDAANKLADWHPETFDGWVTSMAVLGDKIYAGGTSLVFQDDKFYSVGIIDTKGAISYLPTPLNQYVYSLSAFNGKVFLGGDLVLQDSQSRGHLAALDKNGNLTPWKMWVDKEVYSLSISGFRVYVSGAFAYVNGTPKSGLAAITKGDAYLDSIPIPNLTGNPSLLAQSNNKLYIGGSFYLTGAENPSSLMALDLNSGNLLLDWRPSINGTVLSLAATDQHVYVGGGFSQVNGQPRSNVASFDADGVLESWSPKVAQYVYGITPYQQTVYLAGNFQHVNGKSQGGLAALDLNGNLQPFEGKYNLSPKISILNGKVYYASHYLENDAIGTQILRADMNGKDDGWSLKLSLYSEIKSLINDGSSLYIGGSFTDVNGKYTGPFLKVSP